MTTILIALTGLAGSGKDTVADALVTHAGFTKLAFADALRAEVAAAYRLGDDYGILSARRTKETPLGQLALGRCSDEYFVADVATYLGLVVDRQFLEAPRSPRSIMQWWGTQYRRNQQPHYWAAQVVLQVGNLRYMGHDRIVITDCRFENEAAAVRTLGGEVWMVDRPNWQSVEGGHASQTDGRQFAPEAVVYNHAGIVDLAHTTLHTLTLRHGGAVLPDDLFAAE